MEGVIDEYIVCIVATNIPILPLLSLVLINSITMETKLQIVETLLELYTGNPASGHLATFLAFINSCKDEE